MKKKKEETCPKKEEQLIVYHKYPKQWYLDKKNGQISLCKKCIKEVDEKKPFEFVLSPENCDERLKNFLLEKGCPFSSQL